MASPSDRTQRAERAEQMRKEREKADRKQRNLITVAIAVVVVALIAVGGWAIKKSSEDPSETTWLVTPNFVNKSYGFDYTAKDAGGTTGTNPVRVILTEDFQCPVCKAFEEQSGAFLDGLVKRGEITIEYRPIAFLDSRSGNKYSSRAANAALCVLNEGGVAEYKTVHDLLYAHQPEELTDGPENSALIDTARQAGVTGIDACINKKTYGTWLEDALSSAKKEGFPGTPWVRVDGKTIEAPTPENLQKAIAAAK